MGTSAVPTGLELIFRFTQALRLRLRAGLDYSAPAALGFLLVGAAHVLNDFDRTLVGILQIDQFRLLLHRRNGKLVLTQILKPQLFLAYLNAGLKARTSRTSAFQRARQLNRDATPREARLVLLSCLQHSRSFVQGRSQDLQLLLGEREVFVLDGFIHSGDDHGRVAGMFARRVDGRACTRDGRAIRRSGTRARYCAAADSIPRDRRLMAVCIFRTSAPAFSSRAAAFVSIGKRRSLLAEGWSWPLARRPSRTRQSPCHTLRSSKAKRRPRPCE